MKVVPIDVVLMYGEREREGMVTIKRITKLFRKYFQVKKQKCYTENKLVMFAGFDGHLTTHELIFYSQM